MKEVTLSALYDGHCHILLDRQSWEMVEEGAACLVIPLLLLSWRLECSSSSTRMTVYLEGALG